jgi:hypothetical protein
MIYFYYIFNYFIFSFFIALIELQTNSCIKIKENQPIQKPYTQPTQTSQS